MYALHMYECVCVCVCAHYNCLKVKIRFCGKAESKEKAEKNEHGVQNQNKENGMRRRRRRKFFLLVCAAKVVLPFSLKCQLLL